MEWVNYNNYNIIIWNKKTVIRITRSEQFLNVYSWPSSLINKIYIQKSLHVRWVLSSINYKKQLCVLRFDKEKKRSRI